jgi:hypothetical protein
MFGNIGRCRAEGGQPARKRRRFFFADDPEHLAQSRLAQSGCVEGSDADQELI